MTKQTTLYAQSPADIRVGDFVEIKNTSKGFSLPLGLNVIHVRRVSSTEWDVMDATSATTRLDVNNRDLSITIVRNVA